MAKPIKKFRCGGCEAAIFENEIIKDGNSFKVNQVTFQKHYKSADDKWKTTHSLSVNDIPKAVLVLNETYEYLTLGNKGTESKNEIGQS